MLSSSRLLLSTLTLAAASIGLWAQSAPSPARPSLGVALHTEGLAVESVDRGTLADQAGIRPGDFLTHWNDQPTVDIDAIIAARDSAKPGSTVPLRVMRANGEAQVLNVKIPDPIPASGLVLGINIGSGLWVARVNEDSPAALAGIKPGDILVAMGDQAIIDVPSLKDALGRVAWNSAERVTLRRGGNLRRVVVPFQMEDTEGFSFGVGPQGPTKPRRLMPSQGLNWSEMSRSLLGLNEVKANLDATIADLKAMADPKLQAVIESLEQQSDQLSSLAGTVQNLKAWGQGFMMELEEQVPAVPFVRDLDLRNIQQLMEDLMKRHGDDLEAVRRALGDAYPGLEIFIDSVPGHLELKIETEDHDEEDEGDAGEGAENGRLEIIEVGPTPPKKPVK